jgi:H+-transporting ATPase
MTGDGVNDAPALKRADCGVAVEGSTDAARAAADIVLTQPGLSTIVEGIIIARQIFVRMKTFINYRIAATLQLLVFFFIAVLTLHPSDFKPDWPPFFKMPVLLLMLITLLNDGTLISIGYDSVKASQWPEKWNLPSLFLTSIVLGSVACGSSLLLLWAALDSHNPLGVFAWMHIPPIAYAKITTMIYLKVSISDFLTLFSARTHGGFFFSSMPSPILLAAAMFSLSLSTALASAWPTGVLDSVQISGLAIHSDEHDYTLLPLWIWIYCIIFWFVQDAFKVLSIRLMRHYNIFHINTAKKVNLRESDAADDPRHPLAAQSMDLVPMKLLKARTLAAILTVDKEISSEFQSDPETKQSLVRLSLTLHHMRDRQMKIDTVAVGARRASEGETPRYFPQLQQLSSFQSPTAGPSSSALQIETGLQLDEALAAGMIANSIRGHDQGEINQVIAPVLEAAGKLAALVEK